MWLIFIIYITILSLLLLLLVTLHVVINHYEEIAGLKALVLEAFGDTGDVSRLRRIL